MRELTYSTQNVMHPEYRGNKRLWVDPEVQDIVDRLHNGDATLGWEGDPRLALYLVNTPEGQTWELSRLEADGEYRTVCRSRPNLSLDLSLIRHLVAHDLRKKQEQDILDLVDAENKKIQEKAQSASEDRLIEGLDRAVHGLVKDVGHHY